MWKHTVRILSQLVYPMPEGLWRTGEDWEPAADDAYQLANQRIQDTVATIEAQWPSQGKGWANWPKNFMPRPGAFPDQIRGNLGIYADTHLEAVQQGALQIDRTVREIKESRPEPEAEPESEPEEAEEKAEVPSDSVAERIKNQLLEAIRADRPPPPPPIEVHIIQDKKDESGDAIRWAFGLALSLWVVYNMD